MLSSQMARMLTTILVVMITVPCVAQESSLFDNLRNTEASTAQPMTAEQSAASIELPKGFRTTLVASEPMIRQPITMATDTRGRLWIGENYTYSENSVGYDPTLRDRIVILEDKDGDGKAEGKKVFFDSAERLTSIEIDRDGVWAICLPQLLFIPDRNHDDKPDGPPEVILDGFEYIKARHTVANGLRWGPDGWLYGRQGILGTSMVGATGSPDDQRTEVNVGVWRYHPTSKRFEIVARGTTNPWGMDWDAKGEAFFINTVIGHLWHVIPGAHYRRMFGDDSDPHTYELIEQHADHVHWASGEVWTDVRQGVTDATLQAGGGHAHTGLLIYQGGQWPEYWNGKLLTINFHGRRLNVERLDKQGSGFVGKREPDSFAFADPWFRGIDLIAAPDGGIFVSDWSDTGECHDHDGIHRTSGRIFKINYGTSTAKANYDLTKETWESLAAMQSSDNDWFARQARREMVGRIADGQSISKQAIRQLNAMLSSDRVDHQLRALWSLAQTRSITPLELATYASIPSLDEAFRIWSLRLLADRVSGPELAKELVEAGAANSTAAIRLAIASLLQRVPPKDRVECLSRLLRNNLDDADHNLPLMLWYATYPVAELRDGSFEKLIAEASVSTVQRLGMRLLSEEIDDDLERIERVIGSLNSKPSASACRAILQGIAQGISGRRQAPKPKNWDVVVARFQAHNDPQISTLVRDLSAAFGDGRALDQIRLVALNDKADMPQRATALQLLVDNRAPDVREICEQLIRVRGLSATAALGLALSTDDKAGELMIAEWPSMYGHERPPIASILASRPNWARLMLQAISSGKLAKNSISPFQARQIASLYNPELTKLLVDVWGPIEDETSLDRSKAIAKWKSELTADHIKQADLQQGRALFKTSCASCHILNGEGGAIGPELTGASRDNIDYLLDNLLFPSAIVPDVYRQTTLRLNDGRVLTGIVRSRNRKSVKLQTATELSSVSIEDIEEEKQSNLSIMPSGVLDTLTVEQRRDLIGYLMHRN